MIEKFARYTKDHPFARVIDEVRRLAPDLSRILQDEYQVRVIGLRGKYKRREKTAYDPDIYYIWMRVEPVVPPLGAAEAAEKSRHQIDEVAPILEMAAKELQDYLREFDKDLGIRVEPQTWQDGVSELRVTIEFDSWRSTIHYAETHPPRWT